MLGLTDVVSRRVSAGAAVLLAALMLPRAAAADGAFPDSQTILAPADRPHELLLATNFGVISSEDDGQTWTWSCEQAANSFGLFYQLGAPPAHRLFTAAGGHLAFSDDGTCTWGLGGGAIAAREVVDAFPDPSNAQRILAITQAGGDASGSYNIVASSDGGATFGPT